MLEMDRRAEEDREARHLAHEREIFGNDEPWGLPIVPDRKPKAVALRMDAADKIKLESLKRSKHIPADIAKMVRMAKYHRKPIDGEDWR